MADDKQSLVKKYYIDLILSIVFYFILAFILNNSGLIRIGEHLLIFILVTFVYYLVVKNGLERKYMKKIYEIEPELKAKAEEESKVKKNKLKSIVPRLKGKWYKNAITLYFIVFLLIFILYSIYTKAQ